MSPKGDELDRTTPLFCIANLEDLPAKQIAEAFLAETGAACRS